MLSRAGQFCSAGALEFSHSTAGLGLEAYVWEKYCAKNLSKGICAWLSSACCLLRDCVARSLKWRVRLSSSLLRLKYLACSADLFKA